MVSYEFDDIGTFENNDIIVAAFVMALAIHKSMIKMASIISRLHSSTFTITLKSG